MRASRFVPALSLAVLAAAALPAGAQAVPFKSQFTVSPAPISSASSVTVSWARPVSAVAEDEWSLCPEVGGPCRADATDEPAVAFPNLPEGRYRFHVRGRMATPVENSEYWDDETSVVVDRTAPGAPTIVDWRLATAATGTLRPAVAATGDQVAPIARVHWVSCRVEATGRMCLEGSSAPDDVAITVYPPRPAECGGGFIPSSWQVRVWLEDSAGNQDPNASASLAEAPPAVAAAATRSGLVKASCAIAPPTAPKPEDPALRVTGQVRRKGTGRTVTVTVAGARGATGKVALRVTPQRGRKAWRVRRATRTMRNGRAAWTLRVPRRATRVSVVAAYKGSEGFAAGTKRGGLRLTR